MKHLVLALLVYLFFSPAFAADLELALPVDCVVGETCWVQQYADHDAGKGSRDYACGVASYDGHDGTDIRALHTAVDVAVLAAAPGVVKGVRDGVADRLLKTEADRAAVVNIECGNGVVIDHGDGWETQYCHLRRGSVGVKKGDTLATGDKLGLIGFSGDAAFPHVHLSVRRDGKKIDPFSADDIADCKAADRSLWNDAAQKAMPYRGSELLMLQWSDAPYSGDQVETGQFNVHVPTGDEPALVVNAMAINLSKGDTLTLTMTVPGQEPAVNRVVMENNRALQRLFAGKKRRGDWPRGKYVGRFDIVRGGVVMLERQISFDME